MTVEIREAGVQDLADYARVPIRFRIASRYRVEGPGGGPGTFRLVEEPVETPIVRDYDSLENESPGCWPKMFDVTRWGFFIAWDAGVPVGAATVAFDSSDCKMLEGRHDLAALWDIRVHPSRRGGGIGTQLFRRACDWARERGAVRLKIETQNTNVRACRFYANQGCRLESAQRGLYPPPVQEDVMFLWYLDL